MKTPSAGELLHQFLVQSSACKQEATAERYLLVHAKLHRYLEETGNLVLETQQLPYFRREQRKDPSDAFCRSFYAEEVIYALPGFLEPPWLNSNPADRRIQISQTARLTEWLCRSGYVDRFLHSCALLHLEGAIRRARAES
jgi:hypothetical protein